MSGTTARIRMKTLTVLILFQLRYDIVGPRDSKHTTHYRYPFINRRISLSGMFTVIERGPSPSTPRSDVVTIRPDSVCAMLIVESLPVS
jgi:hypothetical protein